MNCPDEFKFLDLVTKLKKKLLELGVVVPDGETTAFNNRIWEVVREAFKRGEHDPQART